MGTWITKCIYIYIYRRLGLLGSIPEVYIFFSVSTPALGPTQPPPVHWVPGVTAWS
jgi:hypothetical protein